MALTEEQRLKRNAYMREWKSRNAEKHRAWSRQYYQNNAEYCRARELKRYYEHQEEIRAKQKAYYRANKDRILARNKVWTHTHPEQAKAAKDAWKIANPERIIAYQRQGRLRRRHGVGHCTSEQLQARIAYYGYRCWLCGAPWEEIDHVKPISKGGSNWPANLRPACRPCNRRKSDHWSLPVSRYLQQRSERILL